MVKPDYDDFRLQEEKERIFSVIQDSLVEAYSYGWTRGVEAGEENKNLSEMDYEMGYRDGLKDGYAEVWNLACSIMFLDAEERCKIFGSSNPFDPNDFARIKFIADKNNTTKPYIVKLFIGDEVDFNGEQGIITRFDDFTERPAKLHVLCADGSTGSWPKKGCVKTGRHFDIVDILKKMRE